MTTPKMQHDSATAPLGRDGGLPYSGALDGLRGAAMCVVVVAHLAPALVPGGLFALDVFFVLSGYFVTRLLLAGEARPGGFSFRRYYSRRVLRVMPPLLATVLLMIPLASAVPYELRNPGPLLSGVWALSNVGNWFEVVRAPELMGYLAHTWTVAIEEQFWLVWPGLFLVVRLRSRGAGPLVAGLALVALLSAVSRAYLRHEVGYAAAFLATTSRSDGLALGCALAVLLQRPRSQYLLERASRGATLPSCALLLLGLVTAHQYESYWPYEWGIPVACLLTCLTVADLTTHPSTWAARLLASSVCSSVGRVSYSVYLVSYPIAALLLQTAHTSNVGRLALGAPATAGAACLLYQCIEKPALTARQRLGW